ncbi:MAG: DUF6531 domain-containing protein, partial [Lachnoclostridium sp.]|nr:DUF6531 domain-containing protein [Lachnoclostridium sp.]
MFYQVPAITVPTEKLSVTIAPCYNSQSTENQGMGPGWHMNYSDTVEVLKDATGVIYGYRYQDETGADYLMDQYHAGEGGYKSSEHPDLCLV